MEEEKLDKVVLDKLGLPYGKEPEMLAWKEFLFKFKNPKSQVNIGIIGKYIELKDSYKSITESIIHAGTINQINVNLVWIHSEDIDEKNADSLLKNLDGILVAPGFGERGIEGKVTTVKYARQNKIPFLGICLGMQCAVIEFGRNVLGFNDAHSTEMYPETPYPVIYLMEEQRGIVNKGGTMRLGAYPCKVENNTKAHEAYKENVISERHRHRYEFNNKYLAEYEKAGMKATGINPENNLVEIVEIPNHPWFVGVQFHPEYKSTVTKPHPLFVDFIKATLQLKESKKPSAVLNN